MPQFLRPDSNVTQTLYTGGFAEIDEVTANDADFATGTANTIQPILEVGLSNPSFTPGGMLGTVRWRSAIRNGNNVIGSGNAITGTCLLLQGATTIASDAYTAGNWSTRTFTFSLSSVTNFSDLRLRFTQTASGGSNNATRTGLAVSWAEVEVPNPRRVILIQ